MTYTHLTTNELVMIEAYYQENTKVSDIVTSLGRSKQTIYNVINYLKEGHSAYDYYNRYKVNKKRCGRNKTSLTQSEKVFIKTYLEQNWKTLCTQARVPDFINQNEMDEILNVSVSWDRKRFGKSFKPIK